MEDYQTAQVELDALSEQWQKTIEAKYAELEELRKAFKAEQILLTDEMKKKERGRNCQKRRRSQNLPKTKVWVRR